MVAYVWQSVIQMAETEFNMKFRSLQEIHNQGSLQDSPLEFIREAAQQEEITNPQKLLQGAGRTKRLLPGRMYMMRYKPQNMNTLPYWDMFPVFFCIHAGKHYFTGLNLHYLEPILRAELMNAFYPFVMAPNVRGEEMQQTMRTKLMERVNYSFMKRRRTMRSFKPCWKKYRYENVVGSYLYVPPVAWDAVMMMPLQRFRKAGINRVWRDSRKIRLGQKP